MHLFAGLTGPEWRELGTFLLALYGAVLATFAAIRAAKVYRQQRRDRVPDIRVKLSEMVVSTDQSDVLCCEVTNHGLVPVYLNKWILRFKDRDQMLFVLCPAMLSPRFPHDLEPGKAVTFLFYVKGLLNYADEKGFPDVVPVYAEIYDALGRAHASEPIDFRVAHWRENPPEAPPDALFG